MATKKKNPYEEWGLQQAGVLVDKENSSNPYEAWGQQESSKERDKKLIWNWDEPSKSELARQTAQKVVEKEERRKKAEDEAKERTKYTGRLWGMPQRIGDIFEANSPQDQYKREQKGEETIYEDQKAIDANPESVRHTDEYRAETIKRRDELNEKLRSGQIDQEEFNTEFQKKLVNRISPNRVTEEEMLAFKQAGIDQLKQRYEEGKITKDAFFAAADSVRSFGDRATTAKEVMTPDKARSTIGQIVGGFGHGLTSNIIAAPGNVASLAGGIVEQATPFNGVGQSMQNWGSKSDEALDLLAQWTGNARAGENSFIVNSAGAIGQMGNSLMMAGMGGTKLPSTVYGVQAAADQYRDVKAADKSNLQALTTGAIAGVTEAGLEKVGLDSFLNRSGTKIGKALWRMATEGSQEATQSIAQSGISATYKDVDFADAVQQSAMEGMYGAIAGGAGNIAINTTQKLIDKGMAPELAQKLGLKAQDIYDQAWKSRSDWEKEAIRASAAEQGLGVDDEGKVTKLETPATDEQAPGTTVDPTVTPPAPGTVVEPGTEQQPTVEPTPQPTVEQPVPPTTPDPNTVVIGQDGQIKPNEPTVVEPAQTPATADPATSVQEPPHITKGRELAAKMDDTSIRELVSKSIVSQGAKLEDVKKGQGGGTLGDFVGSYSVGGYIDGKRVNTNTVVVNMADGRVIKYPLKSFFTESNAPVVQSKTVTQGGSTVSAPVAQPKPEAPDPIAALKQEALKYKSAEEFILNNRDKIGPSNEIILDDGTVVTAREFYNDAKSIPQAPKPEAPKSAPIEETPQDGQQNPKRISHTDAKLVYPETEDLPNEIRDRMPQQDGNKYTMTTVSGAKVAVPDKALNDTAAQYKFIQRVAIKEARAKGDKEAVARFKIKPAEGISPELGHEMANYAFGETEGRHKPQLEDAGLKKTSEVTQEEVNRAVEGSESALFGRDTLKNMAKIIPDLANYPVLYVKVNENGSYSFEYEGKGTGTTTYKTSISAAGLGISNDRLAAAGLKDGMKIDVSEAMTTKNRVPAINRGGVNYEKSEDTDNETETNKKKPENTTGKKKSERRQEWAGSKTPEELIAKIDQLNKAGQKNSILRRGGLRSKKAAGRFKHFSHARGNTGEENIALQDSVILDAAHYVTTLSHELAHAIEWVMTGYTGFRTFNMLGATTNEQKAEMKAELEAVVDYIESKAVADKDPKYYYSNTEMWARYIELYVMEKTAATELAPKVTEGFENLVAENGAVADLYNALEGNIDKGWRSAKWTQPMKDLRQNFQMHLGKTVGDVAYDAEIVLRADKQRRAKMIEKMIKEKRKKIKDSGEKIMDAVQAIRLLDGKTEFGTMDRVQTGEKELALQKDLTERGYKIESKTLDSNGVVTLTYAKVRFTPEQAREIIDSLTPEGRQFVEEYNAAASEATDMVNRELIRADNRIEGFQEGWAPHIFKNGRVPNSSPKPLKKRRLGISKRRTGVEGYEKDFWKAMQKALTDTELTKLNNDFILRQLARISKPIPKGGRVDPGWVEVVYDKNGGMMMPGMSHSTMTIEQILLTENEQTGELEKEGISRKTFKKPTQSYQVPENIAKHYENIRGIAKELNAMASTLDFISKYWVINVLTHPGTTGTNFISGALQYTMKLQVDFFRDVLRGLNIHENGHWMQQTRSNLVAPILALTPRGWTRAPSWMWGGFRSNLYGSMMENNPQQKLSRYGDTMLKGFSAVEMYWKRVIALSEGSNLSKQHIGREIAELNRMEKAMIAEINKAIDLYAYDYDNVPAWLATFDNSTGGRLIKPFMKYPYKYTKMLMHHATAPFDPSLSWQDRLSKGLAFTSMIFIISMLLDDREEEQETPKGGAETPYSLRPQGRVFAMESGGKELFVRTAKYPFFNVTALGKSLLSGELDQTVDLLREQYGTVGLGMDIWMLATGTKSEFDQYKSAATILGEQTASLVPGFRIIGDVGKIIDPQQRKPENFIQGMMNQLIVWGGEETKAKYRGKPRTIDIPIEPETRIMTDKYKEKTTRPMVYNQEDVLRSLITGIYVSRIDPNEANQQQLRIVRNLAEEEIRALLRVDPYSEEARKIADNFGFTIAEGTIEAYAKKAK